MVEGDSVQRSNPAVAQGADTPSRLGVALFDEAAICGPSLRSAANPSSAGPGGKAGLLTWGLVGQEFVRGHPV